MLIAKKFQSLATVFAQELDVFSCKFVEVAVDFALSRFVNLGGLLLGSEFDVLFNLSSLNSFDIENEAHQVRKSLRGSLHNIFVPDDVGWDVLLHPPFMEFFPDDNVLF